MTEALSSAPPAPRQGFYVDGVRWCCQGAVTLSNSTIVLQNSERLPLPTSGVIDLSGMGEVDSAALAVFLSLLRRADHEGLTLRFQLVPEALCTLAHVYGVDSLMELQARAGDFSRKI